MAVAIRDVSFRNKYLVSLVVVLVHLQSFASHREQDALVSLAFEYLVTELQRPAVLRSFVFMQFSVHTEHCWFAHRSCGELFKF